MKILVDSSVWIDFFGDIQNPQVGKLEQAIMQREDICVCGFVVTEVLQGIRIQSAFERTRKELRELLYLEDRRSTFELASTMYRELRRRGITIRKTIDCMIAAVVVQSGVHLLQSDRDFEQIDRHFPLKLL